MKQEWVSNFVGGAVIGLIALALDYFFLQHFFRTPISMSRGISIWAVLIYVLVPFLILQFSGKAKAVPDSKVDR